MSKLCDVGLIFPKRGCDFFKKAFLDKNFLKKEKLGSDGKAIGVDSLGGGTEAISRDLEEAERGGRRVVAWTTHVIWLGNTRGVRPGFGDSVR